MKKSLLTIATAAVMVAPAISMAETTLYGNIHASLNQFDDGTATGTVSNNAGSGSMDLDFTSNTSALGVKGSENLGDGVKAIYKAEFQLNATDNAGGGNALTQRDVFVGLKGGMGTVKFGIFSSNYKQMGGKVDALYRTRLEGRGFLNTQSAALHGGRGLNRGRQTNTLQYTSPKMGGIQLVVNTTLSGADGNTTGSGGTGTEETTGVGIRWANKNILAYLDWIDGMDGTTTGNSVDTEAATKIGAKYHTKAFHVAGQYEDAEDRTGYNFIHLNGAYNINKNNSIILTVGQAEHITSTLLDTTGVAVAYNHKMSKMTNVYVGYGDRSSDTVSLEDSVITAGIKKKF